jgi:sialate O-acetylesterase
MNKRIVSTLPVIIFVGMIAGSAISAENRKMPKQDVIDVPAIGEGLCVHNLFQSNMVLQRDKPVAVWGWAAPGEQVTVSFAGQTQTATDRQRPGLESHPRRHADKCPSTENDRAGQG